MYVLSVKRITGFQSSSMTFQWNMMSFSFKNGPAMEQMETYHRTLKTP